jgi:hypothetical protein
VADPVSAQPTAEDLHAFGQRFIVGTTSEVVAQLQELAAGMQRLRLEERAKPDRAFGTPRRKELWHSGYVAGVCAAIAKLIGEPAATIEARIVAEVEAS